MFRKRDDEKQSRRRAITGGWKKIPRRFKVVFVLFGAGVIGACAGTYASFTATTTSTGNTITAASVGLSNTSGGQAMFNLSDWAPGDTKQACIQIQNTSTINTNVGFGGYISSGSTSLDDNVVVVVIRGSFSNPNSPPTFPSCTGFTPDSTDYKGMGAGILYFTTLNLLPNAPGAAALEPTQSSPATWAPGDKHAYQITISLSNVAAAQGLSGTYNFTWGATSQ